MASKRRKKLLYRITHSFIILGIAGSLFVTGGFILWASTLKIPDLTSIDQRKVAQSTKIYDRTGEVLLFDVHENVKRTLVPFSEISIHLKNATVAIEDAEFYEHNGIKPKAILRAVLVNIGARGFSQGGSTITQQVIKNSVLTTEKKISRKLKEWVLALKLEKILTKDQILELYLNESPYGGNLYGVEEASQSFFNKSATDLTLAESAYLAALPQAPTYYSPYGSHKDALEARKTLVLAQMLQNNFITKEEYNEARNEEVVFSQSRNTGIKAPHFVMYVREYLAERYGERAIEERGFKVITTLDYALQEIGEEVVERFARENTEKFNASNAGLLAIDPKTGQILVMVGSRNFFDEEIDGNFNITTAHRQPGSAFKPFIYAAALSKGFTPETVVFDVATQFSTNCDFDVLETKENCYSPVNYDNSYHGPMTFRNALAQSVNIPAVKVMYLAGLNESLQTARSMGIASLTDINRYGLTLVLGGGEVSLLNITSSYGVFANEGVRNPHTSILRIEDNNGNIIEEFSPHPVRVLPDQIALQITDILGDNEARTPAFGSRSFLHFPGRDVAAKTGTTNDFRDAWIIGYTPNIAVGAWAGNNDNSAMEKKVAGFIIAPLWNAFLQEAFKQIPEEQFRHPIPQNVDSLPPILRGVWEGGETYYIDRITGARATEFTPLDLRVERVVKDVHSILHWVDKDSPQAPRPNILELEKDPQYRAWEYGVEQWKIENGVIDDSATSSATTTLIFDAVHRPEYNPVITFTSPNPGETYVKNIPIPVRIQYTSKFPLARLDVFVNGRFITSVNQAPFEAQLNVQDMEDIHETNTLKVVGFDSVLNKGEVEIPLFIQP